MSYHTNIYILLFLPLIIALNWITPRKYRWIILLGASCVFYWSMSGILILYLIGSTLFTYLMGKVIFRYRQEKQQKQMKAVLRIALIVLIAGLAYMNYYNFIAVNIDKLLVALGTGLYIEMRNLIVPIGISYFTLESIGYLLDIYWKRADAETNPLKLLLFFGFFPKVVEGPICSYREVSKGLWEGSEFHWSYFHIGLYRILLGLMKKMVVADRLNTVVATIYNNEIHYSGVYILVAGICYTIQLYMEFSGIMDVVIGSAQMLGITLPENFRRPFFSKGPAEFWRRWHITLGVWLKGYVFYPVTTSKSVKRWNKYARKKYGKYITMLGTSMAALFPVWFCNGLWHGPQWNYLLYGMYYFVLLMIEVALTPIHNGIEKKCATGITKKIWIVFSVLKTWLIIVIGELIFRANSYQQALRMLCNMFKGFRLSELGGGTMLQQGIEFADWLAILIGWIIVIIIDIYEEKHEAEGKKATFLLPLLLPIILIFGAYGAGYRPVDLIYAGF